MKAWNWLSGKKTNIGMLILIAAQGLEVFFPDLLNAGQINFLQTVGSALGGVGLMHKGTKTHAGQKLIQPIKNSINSKKQ